MHDRVLRAQRGLCETRLTAAYVPLSLPLRGVRTNYACCGTIVAARQQCGCCWLLLVLLLLE
jgi:hypothetical protein